MSVGVQGRIDTRQVEAGLVAMGNDRAVALAMRALRKPMRVDQRDHARQAEGPEGKWPARRVLARRSRRRRLASRRRLLGKLPAAITVTATKIGVSAVSRVRWSGVHQEGGPVGRGASVPARPFLWVSHELLDQAAEAIARATVEAF